MTPHDLWTDALDRLDVYVAALAAALDGGDVTIVPDYVIPVGLPALPSTCADRARQIEHRHSALQRRVSEQLAAASQRLSRPRRPVATQRAAARFEAHA